jgi:hypothetical protein
VLDRCVNSSMIRSEGLFCTSFLIQYIFFVDLSINNCVCISANFFHFSDNVIAGISETENIIIDAPGL